MDTFGFLVFPLGVLGFSFALAALHRIHNLEKKLKQLNVIPRNFDSSGELSEVESE